MSYDMTHYEYVEYDKYWKNIENQTKHLQIF